MVYEKISGFSDEISSDIKIQFQTLNKLGIGFFEVRGVNGKNISLLSDEEIFELKEQMNAYGITVSSIGSPIGKIKINEPFEEHFVLFKRVVQIAKMLGSKFIRIFSFYHDGNSWNEVERVEVFHRMSMMTEYAKTEGVVLLHENEKGIYGDTPEKCKELMEAFGGDYFGAVFDPANFVQIGVDTQKAFEVLKENIKYIHIKDALLKDGSVVPPGQGDGKLEALLWQLINSGYEGFISLEPHLGSFEGLANLELEDTMLKLPKGGEDTFALAYHNLLSILDNMKRG